MGTEERVAFQYMLWEVANHEWLDPTLEVHVLSTTNE